MKVMLIGGPGGGKSTLAAALHRGTGWPLLTLDQVWHATDYSAAAKRQFIATQCAFMAKHPNWLIDGNYTSTLPLRLAQADLVVWVRVAAPVAVLRVIQRSLRFRRDPSTRPDMAPGFQEHFDADYLAFLKYTATFRSAKAPALIKLLATVPSGKLRIIDSSAGKSALIGDLTAVAGG